MIASRRPGWGAGELSLLLDERRYRVGHGPCLDSSRLGTELHLRDMAHETRWPERNAFDILRRISQDTNRKLRDGAQALLDTAAAPVDRAEKQHVARGTSGRRSAERRRTRAGYSVWV